MEQATTDVDMTTVVYDKQRYGCHLWIRRDRKIEIGHVWDDDRVVGVMTRWLARCVRDAPVVIGAAHVEVCEEFLTGERMLRAWAFAFQDVAPEDRETLARWVDRPHFDAVQIPRFAPFPWERKKSAGERGQKNPPVSGDLA